MVQNRPAISDLAALAIQGRGQSHGGGRGRHSALTRFLSQDPDALVVLMDLEGLTWSALASHLGTLGIRDGDGKPPTAERVRKAFWAVQAGRKSRKRLPTPVQATVAPPVPTPAPSLKPTSTPMTTSSARVPEDDILSALCGTPIPMPPPVRKKSC